MNTDKTISELAAQAGATTSEANLGPREIVEFYVDSVGCAVVTTASGDTYTAAKASDVPPQFNSRGVLTTESLLRILLPELHRYDGTVPRGVRFYRSRRLVCGEPIIEFREAGR